LPDDGLLSDSPLDPVIILTVRAYDLGIPSLDAEVPVHIFTEDVSSRSMRFIVNLPPETVEEQEDEIRCRNGNPAFLTILITLI